MAGPPVPPAMRARVILPFALCTLIWGSTWLAIRHQFGAVPPEWSIAYRFGIAAAVMFAVARTRDGGIAIAGRGHRLAFVIGATQFVLNYQCVYGAERHIASGLVALISALLLVSNAALARVFLGARMSRRFVAGSAVALGGIALLAAHELDRAGADAANTALGVALTLGGMLAASSANVLQGTTLARGVPAARLLAWAMLYGTLLNTGIALAWAGPPVFDGRPGYVLPLLYLAVAGSAVTFTLYFGLIRAIGPARAAYSSVLSPVIAMALSTLFEGYAWSLAAGAGAALAIAGLLVALSARRPAR